MNKSPVENLGFIEIGVVGDMIYRAVRFPEYIAADRDGKCSIMPLFTASIAPEARTSGLAYRTETVNDPVQFIFEPQQ